MKLAPPQNTLQPLPPDVQPAVSQSVQRTASPTDIQNAQLSQQSQQDIVQGQTTGQPSALNVAQFSSAPDSTVLWIILVIAIIVAAGAAWLWRSF
jgi:hypothetical protein